ncbi:MAG: histidinol-phosphate transaminase [Ignisphaera sp.]|uniref:Aminotransferase n=1 Tax=Ignisphaera aggregans TaxID=334771 RepID=A0A7C4NJD5_9CREN
MRFHGGDREAKIDFSSNTNPLGPPKELQDTLSICTDISILRSYPDYQYKDLRKLIAEFYDCSPDNVVPTNGSAEAINLIILAAKPKRLVVVEPSYGEYEELAKVLNIDYIDIYYRKREPSFYIDFNDLKEACKDEETLIVITNPNNPSGSYTPINVLFDELGSCRAKVLVDEAYAELCTCCHVEVAKNMPRNFAIVRSLTKWLSIPGLRIGFAYLLDEKLLKRVDMLRQPWNVNSIAECIAVNLLKQRSTLLDFICSSRRYIEIERNRVSKALERLRFKVFESTTNFLLVDLGFDGDKVVSDLRKRGIAVRSCKTFKRLGSNYIRIALRSIDEDNELIKALGQVVYNEVGF